MSSWTGKELIDNDDPEIFWIIKNEKRRQRRGLELSSSEVRISGIAKLCDRQNKTYIDVINTNDVLAFGTAELRFESQVVQLGRKVPY